MTSTHPGRAVSKSVDPITNQNFSYLWFHQSYFSRILFLQVHLINPVSLSSRPWMDAFPAKLPIHIQISLRLHTTHGSGHTVDVDISNYQENWGWEMQNEISEDISVLRTMLKLINFTDFKEKYAIFKSSAVLKLCRQRWHKMRGLSELQQLTG